MDKKKDDGGVVIPLFTGPDDDTIVALLTERMSYAMSRVDEVVEDLNDAIVNAENVPPHDPIMAYGQLTNYLRSLPHDEVVRLLTGALWKLAK